MAVQSWLQQETQEDLQRGKYRSMAMGAAPAWRAKESKGGEMLDVSTSMRVASYPCLSCQCYPKRCHVCGMRGVWWQGEQEQKVVEGRKEQHQGFQRGPPP